MGYKFYNIKYLKEINWQKMFPTLDSDGIDLISKMLEIDPQKRIDGYEALQHPFLN